MNWSITATVFQRELTLHLFDGNFRNMGLMFVQPARPYNTKVTYKIITQRHCCIKLNMYLTKQKILPFPNICSNVKEEGSIQHSFTSEAKSGIRFLRNAWKAVISFSLSFDSSFIGLCLCLWKLKSDCFSRNRMK